MEQGSVGVLCECALSAERAEAHAEEAAEPEPGHGAVA